MRQKIKNDAVRQESADLPQPNIIVLLLRINDYIAFFNTPHDKNHIRCKNIFLQINQLTLLPFGCIFCGVKRHWRLRGLPLYDASVSFLLCFDITNWPYAAFGSTACHIIARGPSRAICTKNFMHNAFDLYLRRADKYMKFIISLKGWNIMTTVPESFGSLVFDSRDRKSTRLNSSHRT